MSFVDTFRAAFGSKASRNRRQRRVAAKTLQGLDDHLLRDIGLLGHEVRAARDERRNAWDFW
jgi:uncharacterized protein YjiS (DUF1127 family)